MDSAFFTAHSGGIVAVCFRWMQGRPEAIRQCCNAMRLLVGRRGRIGCWWHCWCRRSIERDELVDWQRRRVEFLKLVDRCRWGGRWVELLELVDGCGWSGRWVELLEQRRMHILVEQLVGRAKPVGPVVALHARMPAAFDLREQWEVHGRLCAGRRFLRSASGVPCLLSLQSGVFARR